MNIIFSNLEEAEEQLRSMISEIKDDPEYSFEDFHVHIAHLYHHLNTAWNAREVTNEQWRDCAEADFKRWEQFPVGLPLIGADNYYDLPEYRDARDS